MKPIELLAAINKENSFSGKFIRIFEDNQEFSGEIANITFIDEIVAISFLADETSEASDIELHDFLVEVQGSIVLITVPQLMDIEIEL
jgi:hypothetical protein